MQLANKEEADVKEVRGAIFLTFLKEYSAQAFPNLFRLLWRSTLPCYPFSASELSTSTHLLRQCRCTLGTALQRKWCNTHNQSVQSLDPGETLCGPQLMRTC